MENIVHCSGPGGGGSGFPETAGSITSSNSSNRHPDILYSPTNKARIHFSEIKDNFILSYLMIIFLRG